jgi:hypothetical protein
MTLRVLVAIFACGCNVVSGIDEFAIWTASSTIGAGGAGTGGTASGAGGMNLATPASCLEAKTLRPDATDGRYSIDPDGAGALPSFEVECDMTTDGGGWTRFHWVRGEVPENTDPLGGVLPDCSPDAPYCLGRIPEIATPAALLVKDLTDGARAAWRFDETVLGIAVLAALRNKQPACLEDEVPFLPYLTDSVEVYCGLMSTEGGCDSFAYDTACVTSGWTLQLDGDLFFAESAFKLGWTLTSGFCSTDSLWDHGYLDNRGCAEEQGELYYR